MANVHRPFSSSYVVQLTVKNMQNAVTTSINKTAARIAEFENDPEKSKEVLTALSQLHKMKQGLDDFKLAIASDKE